MLAVPVLLAAIGAGLWFGGILPPLLGMGDAKSAPARHVAAKPAEAKAIDSKGAEAKPAVGKPDTAADPAGEQFVDIPDIVANLNNGNRRVTYVKLHARLELAKPEDAPAVQAAMPRVLDMFQTYLREMRPEELRGSAGTYRLREELISRANVALAPARVADILFTELLIQ
jgi:flagellar FliL protein